MPDEGNQTPASTTVSPGSMPAPSTAPAATTPVANIPVTPITSAVPTATSELTPADSPAPINSAPVSTPLDMSPVTNNVSTPLDLPVDAPASPAVSTTTNIVETPASTLATPASAPAVSEPVAPKVESTTPASSDNAGLDLSDWLGSSTKTEEPKPATEPLSSPVVTSEVPKAVVETSTPTATPEPASMAPTEVKVPITINPPSQSTAAQESSLPLSDSYSGPHDITNQISGSETASSLPISQATPLGGTATTNNLQVGNETAEKSAPSPVEKSPSLPLNEIYQPQDAKTSEPTSKSQPDTEVTKEGDSVVATLGEVLGVIGVIIAVLMLVSPVYSSMISGIWNYVKLFGWLGAVGFLLVGFILSFFLKGNILLKVFFCIMLLVATVMYFGVNGSGVITTTLNTYLGTILTGYR